MATPRFIGSEIYRKSRYGGKHPLAIPRVSLAIDLCRALGWLPDAQYVDSPVASVEQLTRFHDPDYVAAVRQCERDRMATDEQRTRFNLGVNGNPVFGEIFRRPATAAGATLHAIGLLRKGGIVFSPAGGTHHGRKDRASGFCFFNDPVLGILSALDKGATRVAYLDIDAHHCDGVEIALGDDRRVMIVSVHEADRWPRTGAESDPSRHIHNYPVPAGFDDKDFESLTNSEILPAVDSFRPAAHRPAMRRRCLGGRPDEQAGAHQRQPCPAGRRSDEAEPTPADNGRRRLQSLGDGALLDPGLGRAQRPRSGKSNLPRGRSRSASRNLEPFPRAQSAGDLVYIS